MNPINALRYLKGFVSFTGTGGFTERFINLCSLRRIHLWDTSFSDGVLFAKCSVTDYMKLRSISKKSGVSLRIKNRYGFSEDMKKQKDRLGLLMGCIFFLLFFTFMSNFVWSIDVSGNVNISKDDVIMWAEKEGLFVGTFKPMFDEVSSANSLSKNNSDVLSWSAINIKGSRAVIEVREQKESIMDTHEKAPCNIISDADGVILSAEIFEGTSDILPGNAVKKGDLLISGVSDNEDMSTLFVEAKGKISALTKRSMGMSFSKNSRCGRISGIRNVYIISIFSVNLPLSLPFGKSETFFEFKRNLSFNSTELPLSLKIRTHYVKEKDVRSRDETFLSALEEFSFEERDFNKNALLLTESFYFEEKKNCFIMKNSWDSVAYIGEKKEISLEN